MGDRPAPDMGATSSSGDLLSRLKELEQKSTLDENVFFEDGWTTVRQLGSGSHGRCYLMKRPDGSLIVHKRIPVSHMIGKHQEVAEREVNILATFNHPYIIQYFRAFVRQGQLCIVMEHASGGDLAAHIRKLCDVGQRPGLATILDWFVQLLLALEYVHGYKVLHRDVALKNVFLSGQGVVKLGDFGVARVLDATGEMAKTKVGTPCYISPERVEGRPYSYESDVWAMGCLLYELLTTRPAFSAETIPEVSKLILAGTMEPFHSDDCVPPELERLTSSILTVATEERPTIQSLLDEDLLQPSLLRHAAVREEHVPGRGIAQPEIPLIGYEGATKTKFSERPIFVDGGGRIVNEEAPSSHDAKLVGARQRRQRQMADRKGAADKFEKVTNFGSGGVVGFLVQAGAAGGPADGGGPADSGAPGGG